MSNRDSSLGQYAVVLVAASVALVVLAPAALAQYESTLEADINLRARDSYSDQGDLTVYDNQLFFWGSDNVYGSGLWSFDARSDDVTFISDIRPYEIKVYDDRLFFYTFYQENYDLWVYDAAMGDITLAADLLPYGPDPSYPFRRYLTVYDGQLFFRGYEQQTGFELWSFDAATGEASLAADIASSSASSLPRELTVYDDRLFFNATSSVTTTGRELFVYDAATGQATLVANINPGGDWSYPTDLTVYDDRLFFTASDGQHGSELWVYDAATDTVALAADIRPGMASSRPSELTVYDDRLFFAATRDDIGNDLWVYDAATGEATKAADITRSRLEQLTVYDDRLFFSAADGSPGGRDVWYYDADADRAFRAADLPSLDLPVPAYAHPLHFTAYDDRLFLALFVEDRFGELRSQGLWSVAPFAVADEPAADQERLTLETPHPNPASGHASLTYTLTEPAPARLAVYDVLGREVAVLADGAHAAGPHKVTVDTSNLAPGLYVVRLTTGDETATQRLTVVR